MQYKPSELVVQEPINNDATSLHELGVPKLFLLVKDLDFTLLYSRLRFAMSKNFFKAPLKCTQRWQIQALSGMQVEDVNLKDNWGATPIHYLAWSGRLLPANKFDLKKQDNQERTPIHYAAWSGEVAILEKIRANYPKELKRKDFSGMTPLHYAAWSGKPKTLDWIKKYYPKWLSKEDNYGRTPMHLAAWAGACAWILANNEKSLEKKDSQGRTPIHYVALANNLDDLIWVKSNYASGLVVRDSTGKTPLHIAVLSGSKEIIDWVITDFSTSHLNKKDKKGATLIHHIAAAGNARALAKALSLKNQSHVWTLCKPFDSGTNRLVIHTLIKALQLNTSLTYIDQNGFPIPEKEKLMICQSLLRNLKIKHSVMRFLAFAQGLSQEDCAISCLLRGSEDNAYFILNYLINDETNDPTLSEFIRQKAMRNVQENEMYSKYHFFTKQEVFIEQQTELVVLESIQNSHLI